MITFFSHKENNMIEITKATFDSEVKKAEGSVLVDFWAPWCGPCRMQTRILESASLDGAKICKCNVDENPDLAEEFGVQAIPTLIAFRGGEVIDRATGVRDEAALKRMLGL